MAVGNAIASGSVIISANADRLAGGLKQADNDVRKWAKGAASSVGNELATELGKRGFAGGVLGGLIGGGIGGAMSELVANTLGELGVTDAINEGIKGFFDWIKGAKETRAVIAGITEELKLAGNQITENLKHSANMRLTMMTVGEQVQSIENDIAGLSKQWNELNKMVEAGNQRIADLSEGPFGGMGFAGMDIGRHTGLINLRVQSMNEMAAQIKKLNEQKDELLTPAPPNSAGIVRTFKELNLEIQKIGKTDIGAKMVDYANMGMTPEQLDRIEQMLIFRRDKLEEIAAQERAMVTADQGAGGMFGGLFAGLRRGLSAGGRLGGQLASQPRGDQTRLAEAVEAGTVQGYSLSVRNRFGGIEAGVDVQKQNGVKLDAIRMTIKDGFDAIKDAMRGVGIL